MSGAQPLILTRPARHCRNLPRRDAVKLAEHILDSKAGRFDPGQFKDEYENALKTLVRRKAKGRTIEVPEEQPQPANVINLMDALRESLKGARAPGPARSRRRASTRRKKAA